MDLILTDFAFHFLAFFIFWGQRGFQIDTANRRFTSALALALQHCFDTSPRLDSVFFTGTAFFRKLCFLSISTVFAHFSLFSVLTGVLSLLQKVEMYY